MRISGPMLASKSWSSSTSGSSISGVTVLTVVHRQRSPPAITVHSAASLRPVVAVHAARAPTASGASQRSWRVRVIKIELAIKSCCVALSTTAESGRSVHTGVA